METIRRTKLCVHVRVRKSKKRLNPRKKTNSNHHEECFAYCANDSSVGHPYDDKINFFHAMADVIRTAKDLLFHVDWEVMRTFDVTIRYLDVILLSTRYMNSSLSLSLLIFEVHYADKNKVWSSSILDTSWPSRFLQLDGNQNWSVPDCGNYIDHAHDLVQVAERSIASSRNKREKLDNVKKFKFFKAMSKMQEIKKKYYETYK